jgi:uncharacterized protein (DUF1501 family)
VFKGVLMAHLGVSGSALVTRVFPGSGNAKPAGNLVAATQAVG